jgi:hypothetical protein
MNIIVIEKDGNLFEKNVKSIDKLYSVCGYRSNKDFEKLYEWEFDKNMYELYGKKNGKQDKENNYKFPNINEIYYGVLSIVKKNGSITIDEWNIFHMSFSSILINTNTPNESDDESEYHDEDIENKIQYDDELNYEEYEEE